MLNSPWDQKISVNHNILGNGREGSWLVVQNASPVEDGDGGAPTLSSKKPDKVSI
jgi:hypothetical protein